MDFGVVGVGVSEKRAWSGEGIGDFSVQEKKNR